MKEIPLSGIHGNGKFALVDDDDFEKFGHLRWHSSEGYVARASKQLRKNILLSREIMNAKIGEQVDHKDGNKLNNQKSNLRICTSLQNNKNLPKRNRGNNTFKGVTWDKKNKKWLASIVCNRKYIHIGRFNDEVLAAKAYDTKAIELHGEFARLNFQ